MASACVISPLSAFLSTNLNNKIDTYDRLGDRIKRSLGYPLIDLLISSSFCKQVSSFHYPSIARLGFFLESSIAF